MRWHHRHHCPHLRRMMPRGKSKRCSTRLALLGKELPWKEVNSSANTCSLHPSCSSREQKIRTDNIIKRIKLNAPNSRSSILSKRDVGGDYHPLGENVSPLFCIRKVSSKQTLRYMYAHNSCAFVGPIVVNDV